MNLIYRYMVYEPYVNLKNSLKYAKFSTQGLIQKAKNPILITPRIPMPYPFLGSNQRRKMEGHLWVTAIQFAVPS